MAEQARELVARIHRPWPGVAIADLLRAFRFARDAEELLRTGARQVGFR